MLQDWPHNCKCCHCVRCLLPGQLLHKASPEQCQCSHAGTDPAFRDGPDLRHLAGVHCIHKHSNCHWLTCNIQDFPLGHAIKGLGNHVHVGPNLFRFCLPELLLQVGENSPNFTQADQYICPAHPRIDQMWKAIWFANVWILFHLRLWDWPNFRHESCKVCMAMHIVPCQIDQCGLVQICKCVWAQPCK